MEGYCEDEKCNRDGCEGIIREKDIDGGCSCHISPPCGYCTEPKNYCSECNWDEREERDEQDKKQTNYWEEYRKRPDVIENEKRLVEEEKIFYEMYNGNVPVDKYHSKHRAHTHFTQIIFGIHPNMKVSEIREKVKGTFGGRFVRFDEYSFKYIAYTD